MCLPPRVTGLRVRRVRVRVVTRSTRAHTVPVLRVYGFLRVATRAWGCGHRLRCKYHLSAEEWSVIEELVTVLQRYKSATVFFSRDATSIAAVIPAMDKLDDHLKSIQSAPEQFHPSILAAMKLARKKMDRYWKRTDESDVYRITMVLHPGLKLEYFRAHNWEEEWIEAAEHVTQEEYVLHYKTQSPAEPSTTSQEMVNANDFSDYSMGPLSSSDELEDYLRQPVEKVSDPLKWWVNNRDTYPTLYRMTLDYLSVPQLRLL